MPKMYKAVAYLRISNADEKVGESESLGNQRNFIQDFVAKQEDIQLISEKLDDGVSGLIFDRPQFQEMMESIQKNEVDCVIVRDLSRLGRDYIQTGEHLRKIFPQLGVRFISILDNIDTQKDGDVSGMLDVTLKTILNDSYSRDISKKTRSALRIKQQNGDYTGACPVYGYQKDKNNHNRLVIDHETAPIVREMFQLKMDGYGSGKIAEIFNERGVPSPLTYKKSKGLPTPTGGFADVLGCKWSATTIIRMLQDSTYIGTLTQGKETTFSYKLKEKKQRPEEEWAVKQNAHDAIVDESIFELVQRLMKLDTRTSPSQESVYLFSGLLVCGCCGCKMVRKTVPHKNKKYVYYACNTGKKNGCTTKMMREDELIELVTGCISDLVNVAMDENVVLEKAEETFRESEQMAELNAKITGVQVQKEETIRIKSTLYENMLAGLITKSEYKDLKADYDKDIAKLTEQESALQAQCHNNPLLEEKRAKWRAVLKELRENTTLDRKIVVSMIDSITIGEEVEITFAFDDVFKDVTEKAHEKEQVVGYG